MRIRTYLISLFLLMVSYSVFADHAAVEMLKQVSQQMISELDKNKGRINTRVVDNIVHQVLLPHVDLESMSRSVVGRDYWKDATPAQREQFKRAFTNLVIKVYATPISTYNGETITFRPLRDTSSARPQVESVIARKNGQRIPVSYRLVQSNGSWKVYDFSVEGISMINSYRSQFDSILHAQGMPGLLRRLSR